MLRYYVFPRLRNYLEDMIIQQDNVCPHYAVFVQQYLAQQLLSRRIKIANLIPEPSRHRNLTTFYCSLWGYQKDFISREHPSATKELRTEIRQGIQTIDENASNGVYKNMENRLCCKLRECGGRLRHLLN